MRFFVFLSALASVQFLSAQDFVINAYYNVSGSTNGEWTEILVLTDGADLGGYVLVDNSLDGSWTGGVTFKNSSPLWRDLRQGTIITINHSNLIEDTQRGDGYLSVNKANFTHLDQYYESIQANEWFDGALSINQTNDMIQLRRPGGQNAHTLANVTNNATYFNAVTGPKIGYSGSLNSFTAVVADPGNSVASYNTGQLTNASTRNPANQLKGKANGDGNSRFIRQLRQPNWTNPAITTATENGSLILTWNPAENDIDDTQGYLIVRSLAGQNITAPVDGRIYNVGDMLGGGRIVGTTNSSNRRFSDPIRNLNCDDEYQYHVYAYRYGKDDENQDNNPTFGRGRSYNETIFASRVVSLNKPPQPSLSGIENGKVILCEGSDVNITIDNTDPDFSYQWYINNKNTPLPGETNSEINISVAGNYLVSIENTSGCTSFSENFEVEVVPAARITLFFSEPSLREIVSDTTLYFCENDNEKLQVASAGDVVWYKDGQPINTSIQITVEDFGDYYAINDQGTCQDTTPTITILPADINVSFNNNTIDYGNITNLGTEQLLITNNSNQNLVIDVPNLTNIPDGVAFFPRLPWNIPAMSDLAVEVRYSTSEPGPFTEFIDFDFRCGNTDRVTLTGNRVTGNLIATPVVLDTSIVDCGIINSHRFQFQIANESVIDLDLAENADGRILLADSDLTVVNGLAESISSENVLNFTIDYNPTKAGLIQTTIKIPFSENGNIWDTLDIPLNIDYRNYDLSHQELYTVAGVGECESEIAVDMDFTNLGLNNSEISYIAEDTRVTINGLDQANTDQRDFFLTAIIENPNAEQIDLRFVNESCQDTFNITVDIQKLGYNYAYDDVLDIDTVYKCLNTDFNISTDINVTGNGTDEIVIKSISTSDDISLNITENDILTIGNNSLDITFNNIEPGRYNGSVDLIVDPCDRAITIDYDFTVVGIDLLVTETEIEILEAEVGQRYEQTFYVTNTTPLTRFFSFTTSNILPNSVRIENDKQNIEVYLEPFGVWEFTVVYEPTEYEQTIESGIDIISLDSISGCLKTEFIELSFSSAKQNKADLKFFAGEWFTLGDGGTQVDNVEVGQMAYIPIFLETDDIDLFRVSGAESLELSFDYDYNEFDLMGMELVQEEAFRNEFAYITNQQKAKVLVDIDNIMALEEGNVFNLYGYALLGDMQFSIELDTAESKSFGNFLLIEYESQESVLTVDSNCAIWVRGIDAYNPPTANILKSDANHYYLRLMSENPSNMKYTISSFTGALVYTDNVVVQGSINIPIEEGLASGHYFINVTDGIYKETFRISVVK